MFPLPPSSRLSGRFDAELAIAELIDQHPRVLGIIDRNIDQMDAAALERGLQRRQQAVHRGDTGALRTVGLRVADEVGIAEGEAEILKVVDRLLPPDHAVGAVIENQDDEVELEPNRGL